MERERIVLSLSRKVPPWLPIICALNSISFTFAFILYDLGFWGMVISFFLSPEMILAFFLSFCVGILCGVITFYLTQYECSFHNHRDTPLCP